jgi:ubiquinone/menaquinone biosynthesis C-methylase UbiE
MERYVIRGGRAGYDRLQVLTRDRWPTTRALFARAGVGAGMRCVDLGCGGGEVTFELAKLVAPGGEAAADRGLTNVEFRALNVNAWDEPAAYDVVYGRFLLQHLRQPVALLRRMWAAVRPGGVIIVEDADFDGWCCHPPLEAFDFFSRIYNEVLERRGGDHEAGRKLYEWFLAVGIPEPEVALVQAVWTAGEAKTLAWSTLEATGEAIVSEGLASAAELTAALTSLERYTADPQTLICGPRVFQLWSRRPAP